jgi:hypothetical protein
MKRPTSNGIIMFTLDPEALAQDLKEHNERGRQRLSQALLLSYKNRKESSAHKRRKSNRSSWISIIRRLFAMNKKEKQKAKKRAYAKLYYQKNKEKWNGYAKKTYQKNRKAILKRKRKEYWEDPEKQRERVRARYWADPEKQRSRKRGK